MKFSKFAEIIRKRFDELAQQGTLYEIDVSRDEIYELYLESYPKGSNEIYKERREHDCNVCKNFIRDVGGVVIIINGELQSIWDVEAEGCFQVVADALDTFVRSKVIKNVFTHSEKTAGCPVTQQQLEDGKIISWNHLSCSIPSTCVGINPTTLGYTRTSKEVFKRGLDEISMGALDIVLELIAQKSLYKGEEFQAKLVDFKKLKNIYDDLDDNLKDNFCWSNVSSYTARIRNEVIGTLLQDISNGVELDVAVASYESKVAPANYKRPTALITKGMITEAMKTIESLNIKDSLERRFAKVEDISINNVLFADKAVSPAMKDTLLETLMGEAKTSSKKFTNVDEISINDFIKDVVPNISSMEVLVANQHSGNFVSLIAPIHEDAPNILKWDNNFSWSYSGNVTDSMKARVKSAGGKVDGVLRFSIQWNEDREDTQNDLDAHCIEPGGCHIYYGKAVNYATKGRLDVDIQVPDQKTAVENITWPSIMVMPDGTYKFSVHNFSRRNTKGFRAEIEFDGVVHAFDYPASVKSKAFIEVAEVTLKDGKFSIKEIISSQASSKDIWGVKTEKFHKVSLMSLSPNFWDEQTIGNKHFFFFLDGCKNPEQPRGIYNEFLKGSLDKHRKVFEVLGSKTKCQLSDEQISGVGFSSTQRNSIVCKVKGAFTRTLKINF